jgi:hypothetical protein
MEDASRIKARPHSTVTVCWAWGAAWYLVLPAWLASMTQVPGLSKVTVEPEMEHAELLAGSMLKVTWLPDPPPVAVTA